MTLLIVIILILVFDLFGKYSKMWAEARYASCDWSKIVYKKGVLMCLVSLFFHFRKQERKIRGMLVDYRKRAERRQDFYEKIVSELIMTNVKIHPYVDCVYFVVLKNIFVNFFYCPL